MGHAHNNNSNNNNNNNPIIIKTKESPSFIEEFPSDSFIDSLLNFEEWGVDKDIVAIMNSKPNLVEEEEEVNNKEIDIIIKQEEVDVCDKLDDLIQQRMDKVCLTSSDAADGIESTSLVIKDEVVVENEDKIDTNGINNGDVKVELDDNDNEEEEEVEDDSSSSSSSGSSSSSSDDEDEEEEDSEEDDEGKKVKGDGEMEEGEIMEEMVAWSDNDDGDEEDVVKGPIRSRNEVQDLPPVPPVTVTIQPHHQTLPVGVVLSIMGAQVIVEGVENHNPLSEGSILWITESRSPLGVVDEIFGPVKNPYYIVRYNSEIEVPTAIQQGSLVSFVPEFADYVLNNNNLYKKGYDASGENDEELSEELEFSDDEKEAEYKKMIKMSKRNLSEQKNGHKKDKKSRNRGGKWKNDPQCLANLQVNGSSGGPTRGPHAVSPSQVNGSSGGPTSGSQGFAQSSQTPNFNGPPLGVWPNGFPSMQPQNIGFPQNGFPSNVPFMQQSFTQQPFQNLGLPNLAPFLPQFNNSGQMFPSNFVQGVPPNYGANLAFASWPTGMPQNNFNQSQVGAPMMFQGLQQGVAMPNGLQMENNLRPPFAAAAANAQTSQSSDQGNGLSNRGGRQPFQRGGGRFRGGRRGRSGPQSR
uniref:H/ACA ribonucleoprotein complex non-core subunit NAF1-like n=1 Tax=Erigeron canadensis TaxID=72917 RepID=UPI001CB8BC1A|nr:H/ACA ribonucleoprotein complex non-core subunit NAF1-like [Erigeron canadensis]